MRDAQSFRSNVSSKSGARIIVSTKPKPGIVKRPPRDGGQSEAHDESVFGVAKRIISNSRFDVVIGIVIVFNSATIGLEQTLELHGDSTLATTIMESVFLLIYIAELALRFLADGLEAFRGGWVKFDFFLVVVGIIGSWVFEPFVRGSASSAMAPIMILRTLRLLRLAKTVRLFSRVQECWMLVRGFMNSANVLIYAFIMLFGLIYIFSCLSLELITKRGLTHEDPVYQAQVERYFSSLPHTMLTLVRFACLDNLSEVYQPLVEREPYLAVFFISIIFTVSMVMYHILGAVIFSSTLDQNIEEMDEEKLQHEEEWSSLIADIKAMFVRIDTDCSGSLSRLEMLNMSNKDEARLSNILGVKTPGAIFNALDADLDGEISVTEWFDGLWDASIGKSDVELRRAEKQLEAIHWRTKETFGTQLDLQVQLTRLLKELELAKGGPAPSDVGSMMSWGSNQDPPSSRSGCSPAPGRPSNVGLGFLGQGRNSYLSDEGSIISSVAAPVKAVSAPTLPKPRRDLDILQDLEARLQTSWQEHLDSALAEVQNVLDAAEAKSRKTSPRAKSRGRSDVRAANTGTNASKGKRAQSPLSNPVEPTKSDLSTEAPKVQSLPQKQTQRPVEIPKAGSPERLPSVPATIRGERVMGERAPIRRLTTSTQASSGSKHGGQEPNGGSI